MGMWYLESNFHNDNVIEKLHLKDLPQIVGRDDSLACTIMAPSVSRRHAQIEEREGHLWINDLSSRNGTFVNHERINQATKVAHGDIIHLGSTELRLINQHHSRAQEEVADPDNDSETTVFSQAQLSKHFPTGVRQLEELIDKKLVSMVYQPIIEAKRLTTCAFEVLGRGASRELPPSPGELFRIAESFGLEVALSDLMRNCGVDVAVENNIRSTLLVNIHPQEMKNPDLLLASLTKLRQRHRKIPLVLEIHEQCVADVELLKDFKKALKKLNIKLAFDDFGVGQSRLMEMVEAKPDLIKFDRVLIDHLESADQSKIALVKHLKDLASELKIQTLAECVETEAEYKACDKLGFELYQGFHFCRPLSPEAASDRCHKKR